MKVRIWGTRGSTPISSLDCSTFGGNTTCVTVTSRDGVRVVIDSGTGIRDLGNQLLETLPVELHLLYTHYHWDHVLGFPFFVPAFIPGNSIKIYGQTKDGVSVKDVLEKRLMSPPNFPVAMDVMGADLEFIELSERGEIQFDENFKVKYGPLFHPNGVLGFRFEDYGKVFTFLTDVEHTSEIEPADEPLELSRNAEVVAYDCQYTPDQYLTRVNWGHSTYEAGLRLVEKANACKLLMIHHDPAHNDQKIRDMEANAKLIANNMGLQVEAAYEGLEFEI